MSIKALTDQQLAFIERTGLQLEREGLPRMAGRVLGYLLLCDPPEKSIAEIMQALNASNGSISTMTRMLEQQCLIERFTRPGDRKDYFAVTHNWNQLMAQGIKSLEQFQHMFADALQLAHHDAERRASLEEFRDFFSYLQVEFPALVQRWLDSRKTANTRGNHHL